MCDLRNARPTHCLCGHSGYSTVKLQYEVCIAVFLHFACIRVHAWPAGDFVLSSKVFAVHVQYSDSLTRGISVVYLQIKTLLANLTYLYFVSCYLLA